MKTLPISRYRFFQKIQPLSLLKKITNKSVTGCLQVFSPSGTWSIFIEEGKLIYACYSEKMFEPLYRNLQRLSRQISTIPKGINEQLRAIFETGIENQAIPNPDYLAICWLVNQKYINAAEAGILIEQLALEVLETFLQIEEGSYEFIPDSFLDDLPKFCYLNLRLLVEQCQKYRGEAAGRDASPSYQRQSSFARQNPSQPSVRVPSAQRTGSAPIVENSNYLGNYPHNRGNSLEQVSSPVNDKKIYTIFCIDDSPSVLNAIKNFLDEQMFSVVGVTDSLKALMEILRTKPDLILLDITMPNLDGYELCSLLRKHSQFKNTPVIMVTGKTGLIDRAKAKMVKASGYLTKPFSQGDLLKIVFKYMV